MTIFAFDDYRTFIKSWINSKEKSHGLHGQICRAMECQAAHLSRVLQGKIHLTMDQIFLLSEFMNLSQSESVFLMKLAEYQRAGNIRYRKKLAEEITSLRKAQEDLNERHKLKKIETLKNEVAYYSSWYWTAIHFITGIKKYRSPIMIAERLGLTESFVKSSLEELEKMNLVKRDGEFWSLVPGSINLPKNSPMKPIHHGHWRNRAIMKAHDTSNDGFQYTVIQAIGESDFEKIKQLLLHTTDEYKKISYPSPSEELICFSIDYFRV